MNLWSCAIPVKPEDTLRSDGAAVAVVALLMLAWGFAVAAAPFLSRAYRSYVARLMRLEAVDVPAPAEEIAPLGQSPSWPAGIVTRSLARQRVLAVAALVAAAAFAAACAVVIRSLPAEPWHQADIACACLIAVIYPVYIALPRRYRARWVVLVFALLFAAAAMSPDAPATATAEVQNVESDDERLSVSEEIVAAVMLLAYVVAVSTFVLSGFRRAALGVAMPLFLVLAVALIVCTAVLSGLEARGQLCVGGDGGSLAALAIGVAALLLGWWIGLAGLRAASKIVQRGTCNEACAFALVSLVLGFVCVILVAQPDGDDVPFVAAGWEAPLCLGAAVLVYAAVVKLGRPPRRQGPLLLMLRVFAPTKKSRRLLTSVQDEWRFMGPVYQIGGPDLVAFNIDPDECAAYLGGTLHDLFLPIAVSDDEVRARLKTRSDWEGRFGIHEVFCFNSAWRHTVHQLIRMSDAILLDVRGMNAEREGTSYEIGLLARLGKLPDVLAVGDSTTDWSHINSVLVDAGGDPAALRRVHGRVKSDEIVRELAAIVEAGGASQESGPQPGMSTRAA